MQFVNTEPECSYLESGRGSQIKGIPTMCASPKNVLLSNKGRRKAILTPAVKRATFDTPESKAVSIDISKSRTDLPSKFLCNRSIELKDKSTAIEETHLKMAGGDEAIEGEDILSAFKKRVHECTIDFFKKKLSQRSIIDQYKYFCNERIHYLSLPTLQQQLLNAKKNSALFFKDLANYQEKKTVIIGLEDVLLTMETFPMKDFDVEIEATECQISLGKVYAKYRPHLLEFLEFAASRFELIVSCNGSESYCSGILDAIEKRRKYFTYRIFNYHVLLENTSYIVKDYSFLVSKGRTGDDIAIIDHSVAAFCFEMNNGVLVEKYVPKDEDNDNELIGLAKCLEELAAQPSVKNYIKQFIVNVV